MFDKKDLHDMYDKIHTNESFSQFTMGEITLFCLITTFVCAFAVFGGVMLLDYLSTEFAKWWIHMGL